MSADFWSGYISGAIGIIVGNPLDIIKTKLQAGSAKSAPEVSIAGRGSSPGGSPSASLSGNSTPPSVAQHKPIQRWTSFARGAAAPILGYGALNALLFVSYNRSLALISTGNLHDPSETPSAWSIWTAGAIGGLATFFVSAPTELIKCRAQVSNPPRSSLQIAQELWKAAGLRGLYMGGAVTSIRDAVGYGFYFWSYELSKRALAREDDSSNQEALKVLLEGGLAGVVTWASIFPLDVIKTRVQTWDLARSPASTEHVATESSALLRSSASSSATAKSNIILNRPSGLIIAKEIYRQEGLAAFFRGLGICSARAFFVNAVQWAVYEWMMRTLASAP